MLEKKYIHSPPPVNTQQNKVFDVGTGTNNTDRRHYNISTDSFDSFDTKITKLKNKIINQ